MINNDIVNKSIYDKIIDKGSLDASEIIRLGKQKATSIEESIVNEAKLDSQKLLDNNNKANQDRMKAMTTNFERLAKKEILFKKKELIDDLFLVAINKLKTISDFELFGLVKKLIKNESITGNEVIKVSKSDFGKYLSLFSSGKATDLVELDKLNKELGGSYHLKLSNQPAQIDGGFVIVGEHFDIDLSYSSILNVIKEKNETKIANILFNEEK